MFDSADKLALGLVTGILFGILLQKGRVAKYQVILGQFLLKDWTVVKIMATAVIVGAVGVYALLALGAVSLHLKPMLVGGVVIGGVCFGVGMVVLGYCPGTSVAACGEGRRDAMMGVLGMFFGAGAFVALYALLQPVMKGLGDLGKITVAESLGVTPWLIIAALAIAGAIAVMLVERGGQGPTGWTLPQRARRKHSAASP
jgi:uncharacterized protein